MQDKSARKESFSQAMSTALCPALTLRSFTAAIVIIDIIIFVISLCLKGVSNSDFLAPQQEALDMMGAKISVKMQRDLQIWRFITPVFLHANFMHILFNSVSTLIIGSGLETTLGSSKLAFVYFTSGVGGIAFSCVTNPIPSSVGASTAIAGLIGYYASYLFLNWQKLGREDPARRCNLLMFTIFILLINGMQ
jgi:rhomboid protease GluP